MARAARYAYSCFLEANPSGEERLEGALHLASLCEKDGEIEVAMEIYGSLSGDYPDDPRPKAGHARLKEILQNFGPKSS